jgi:hypothetical protein
LRLERAGGIEEQRFDWKILVAGSLVVDKASWALSGSFGGRKRRREGRERREGIKQGGEERGEKRRRRVDLVIDR